MTRRVLAVALLLFTPGLLHAQEVGLTGTITDTTGAVLPGATITATHTDSGNTFTGVTDTSGNYSLNALRTGRYSLKIELSGFAPITRDNIELAVGQRAVLNFNMSLSALEETITVAGQAPLVDFTQSRVAGVIDQRQMQDLPINGRNWMELTLLAPGSRTNDVSGSLGNAPVGGNASAGSFQLNVDGIQVSNTMACARWGQPKFSRDAMEQFEMVTSRWDATQGRSTQVQVNAVTKAGTNRAAPGSTRRTSSSTASCRSRISRSARRSAGRSCATGSTSSATTTASGSRTATCIPARIPASTHR
jgi:hypothetical protein